MESASRVLFLLYYNATVTAEVRRGARLGDLLADAHLP